MVEVHGFHNQRNNDRNNNNRGNPRGQPQQQQQQQGRFVQMNPDHIPFGSREPTDEVMPSLSARIFPYMKLWTATSILSITQILMMIVSLIVGFGYGGAIVAENAMVGPSTQVFKILQAKYDPEIYWNYQLWRFVVPIFLHGGLLHLFSNLFFQLMFGYTFEKNWGIKRFLAIYFISGIGGTVMSSALGNVFSVSVGASGALFGLLGGYIAYLIYNWDQIPSGPMEMCFIVFIVVINFMFSVGSAEVDSVKPNIDNWAHLGGLVSGICIGFVLVKKLARKESEKLYLGIAIFMTIAYFTIFSIIFWNNSELAKEQTNPDWKPNPSQPGF